MALLTPDEVALRLPKLGAASSDDTARLTAIIAAFGEAIARRCGYPPATVGASPTMESASYTRYLTGRGGRDLTLEPWPVTAIASITDDTTRDFTDASYLVAASDYTLVDGDRGLVVLKSTSTHGAWSCGVRRAIKAVFTAGFVTVPPALKELAIRACIAAWHRKPADDKYEDADFFPPAVEAGLGQFLLPGAVC